MDKEVELQVYISIANRYKWHILFGTLLCVLLSITYTVYVKPEYESSIQLLVSQKQIILNANGNSTAGETYQAIMMSEHLAKTYSEMLQGRSIAEKVIEKLDIPILPRELTERVKAVPVRDTQLIDVTVRDTDPDRAQLIASTIGIVFKEVVGNLDINKISNNYTGKNQSFISISVAEPADVPVEPVEPKPLLNVVIGFVLGLFLSTGTAFFLNHLDTTFKDVDEIEKMSGLISLGKIPLIQKGSEELPVKINPQSFAAEAFHILRTNFQYINFDSDIKTVIVTSAGPGEGKTLFSANFATTLALTGYKVLVVSCDLRRPRLHQVFGANNYIGLANFLIGSSSLDEVIQKTAVKNLEIIVGGPTPPNPVALLESARAERFFMAVRDRYDFVILDCPPISTITDTLALAIRADSVIILAHHARTSREAFICAKNALDKVNARIIGFVLNAATNTNSSRYYDYSYSYRNTPSRLELKRSRVMRIKKISAVFILGLVAIAIALAFNFGLGKTILDAFLTISATVLNFISL